MFLRATSYRKAALCFRIIGRHEDAANALQDGHEHGILIQYLSQNVDQFGPETLRSFARLCALLLKHNQIRPIDRKHAITLLGTPDEQEAAFREYEMTPDLMRLFLGQGRFKEAFDMLIKHRLLEEALEVALIDNATSSAPIVGQEMLVRLMNYVCISSFWRQDFDPAKLSFKSWLTGDLAGLHRAWVATYRHRGMTFAMLRNNSSHVSEGEYRDAFRSARSTLFINQVSH